MTTRLIEECFEMEALEDYLNKWMKAFYLYNPMPVSAVDMFDLKPGMFDLKPGKLIRVRGNKSIKYVSINAVQWR